jgi:hypothetical protein
MNLRKTVLTVSRFVLLAALSTVAPAQQTMDHNTAGHEMPGHQMEMSMGHGHEHHGAGVPVTYQELTSTATQLETARRATEKYKDVRVADADGYKAIGPDVPGMGIHYVHVLGPHAPGFDLERPDILLYEKDTATPGGYALVGVSYLLNAEADADGQPQNPPFPKSLASWHRHSDLCVFPDRSVKANLTGEQCAAQGGRFTALTQWMVHAWIWKDSPAGVFSGTNPTVQ